MKKLLLVFCLLGSPCLADENAFFRVGPLEMNIPMKVGRATYLYDFKAKQNLVGAETPVLSLWNRVEGTVGVLTSLQGAGSPFIGGNIIIGKILEKVVTLPDDLNVGGFGARNFNSGEWMYGIKASIKLWGN